MTRHQPHRELTSANGQRRWARDDDAALRAASLSSPGFTETWQAGSPLDWTEFIARWQSSAEAAGPGGAPPVRPARGPTE